MALKFGRMSAIPPVDLRPSPTDAPARALGLLVDGHPSLCQFAGAVGTSPCDGDTMFSVASISKLVVATLALQCCERGELDLETDVRSILSPLCPIAHPRHPSAPISLRHLLTHTAGLRDDESALKPGPWRSPGRDCDVSLASYVCARFASRGANALSWSYEPPGAAAYHYSNFGFALAGLVLETVTGTPLPPLARSRVFTPLGMNRSAFLIAELDELPAGGGGQSPVVAVPHGPGGEPLGLYGVAEYPAASLRASLTDILRFLGAIVAAASATDAVPADPALPPRILSPASVAAMLPATFTGGLAWWGRDADYGEKRPGVWARCWSHGGFMDGIRTHVHLWPGTGVGGRGSAAVVLLQNGEGPYYAVVDEAVAALQAAEVLRP